MCFTLFGGDHITSLISEIKNNEKLIYKLSRSLNSNKTEDLFQVGVIGLINAYNNYDESFNTKFSTYAYPYILGEMKKYLREDRGIKVNREMMYLSSRLDKLITLLTQKYKRSPSIEELSKETGISIYDISKALDIKNIIKSIDDKDDYSICDEHDPDLFIILDSLEKEEKDFIINRYFNDKSQEEMSKITGFSQAKVSRYENKILTKLRCCYKD